MAKINQTAAAHPLEFRADHTFTFPGAGEGTWELKGLTVQMKIIKSPDPKLIGKTPHMDLTSDLKTLQLGKLHNGNYGMSYAKQ